MRHAAALAALALLIPASLQAQTDTPEATPSEAAILPRILDVLCLELVEALSGCETAVLLASENSPDSADLILIGDRGTSEPQAILAVVRDIAYSGPFFGQSPMLEAGPDSTLLVHEEQSAFGRTPWFQTLTIRHPSGDANSGFVVTGQAYSTYDRPAGGSFSCDVDLTTGDWVAQANRVDPESGVTTSDLSTYGRIAGSPIALEEWSSGRALPEPCATMLTDWFNAAP